MPSSQRKLEDPNIEGFKVVSNIAKSFWNKKKGQFVNGTGGTGDDGNGNFFVWPVAVNVQAVIDAARINKNYVGLLHEVMGGLDKFYSPQTKGFSPTPGGNEFYADDSAQCVYCYITAYEVTSEKQYLDRAVEGMQFLMGMADKDVGGVRWKLGQPGPNTVSTGESGMCAALIAKYVQNNQNYLQFGDYCFNFVFSKMQDESGLMCDGWEGDHRNPMKWTYNQGTPLTLCSLMFALTKDEKYFKAAHGLATAVTDSNSEIFDRDTQNHDVRFYRDSLKFYQLLCAGFADYVLYFGHRDEELSQKIVNTVNKHLYFVFEFMVIPEGDGFYHGNMQLNSLDETRCKVFCNMTGEQKQVEIDTEERKHGKKSNKFAPNFMNQGSAARVFFQSARVVPHVSF